MDSLVIVQFCYVHTSQLLLSHFSCYYKYNNYIFIHILYIIVLRIC